MTFCLIWDIFQSIHCQCSHPSCSSPHSAQIIFCYSAKLQLLLCLAGPLGWVPVENKNASQWKNHLNLILTMGGWRSDSKIFTIIYDKYIYKNSLCFSWLKMLTRNRYWSPYTIELMVRTGFQSSLKMLRQTFPSRSIFGWYTWRVTSVITESCCLKLP